MSFAIQLSADAVLLNIFFQKQDEHKLHDYKEQSF